MRAEGIIACLSQETTDFSHFAALKEINMPLILFRPCLPDRSILVSNSRRSTIRNKWLPSICWTMEVNGSFYRRCQSSDIVKRRKHGYLKPLRDNRILIEKELVVCRKIDYEEGQIATKHYYLSPASRCHPCHE